MWTLLAFISAVCLGFYDVSKKIALRDNRVIDVLTLSVCMSALLLSVPLLLSRACPEFMSGTPFYVPRMDAEAHLFVLLKSVIVLSSWIFGYISLKHLPISVVSPMQATRPVWTLVGALLIFGERLNGWQWSGVLIVIGAVFAMSFQHSSFSLRNPAFNIRRPDNRYYAALVLAILLGACSGLYDKYLMRQYDHNAVQVFYTFYQAIMMLVTYTVMRLSERKKAYCDGTEPDNCGKKSVSIRNIGVIMLISVFLVISDNVYMLALRDPESMIAVVSTIRRGGTLIGFAYGLLVLREPDPWRKAACMAGILNGLVCLAIGA